MLDAERFHELIAAALAGDRLALGLLFLDYHDLIAARVRERIPAPLAELLSVDDLVQQSYLAAIRGLEHYEHRSRESFGA
jgi:DNA-directed RNA polymerase specialized sigma24 family protein